ncbi:MAG: hypothetical protein AB7S26_31370 [Sandaracinaceae bacterium]
MRHDERECPFCGGPVPAVEPISPTALPRLGRAAIFAFGATLAAGATGCGGGPVYGAPPADAGVDAGAQAMYGTPPDAGSADSGTMAAAYGTAPDGG